MKSKKGVSEVVTAILLILLAIAAVIIVWAVVKPLITKPASGAQTDCVTLNLEITKATVGDTEVTIRRSPGAGSLTGGDIVVTHSSGLSATDAKPCDGLSSGLNELDPAKKCTGLTALVAGDKVEVYPRVGVDKTLCPNPVTKTV